MKKLLFGAAAFGLLSSVAIAQPLKLDDAALGETAGGVDIDGSTSYSFMVSQLTETRTENTSSMRSAGQELMSAATNRNYSLGLWSEGVSATGSATSSIMGTIN